MELSNPPNLPPSTSISGIAKMKSQPSIRSMEPGIFLKICSLADAGYSPMVMPANSILVVEITPTYPQLRSGEEPSSTMVELFPAKKTSTVWPGTVVFRNEMKLVVLSIPVSLIRMMVIPCVRFARAAAESGMTRSIVTPLCSIVSSPASMKISRSSRSFVCIVIGISPLVTMVI